MSDPGFVSGHPEPANMDDAATTPIGTVAGAVADNSPETENPMPLAKAVDSADYSPGYTEGDRAVIPIDKDSGGVLCHTRKLTSADDFVSVQGNVEHDSPDVGFPLLLGGRAIGTALYSGGILEPSAVTSGDRVRTQFDLFGRQIVKVGGKDTGTIFSSAARTTTQTSSAMTTAHLRGVSLYFKVTAVTGNPSLVATIEAQNPIDGTFVTIATFTAVTGTGTFFYQMYPGIAETAGQFVSRVLPRVWRVVVTPGTADSCTYSMGFGLEP